MSENTQKTEVQLAPQTKSPIAFSDTGIQLSSMEDAYRFAVCVIKSGLAPKGFDSAQHVERHNIRCAESGERAYPVKRAA
jgi:hypothetical protein